MNGARMPAEQRGPHETPPTEVPTIAMPDNSDAKHRPMSVPTIVRPGHAPNPRRPPRRCRNNVCARSSLPPFARDTLPHMDQKLFRCARAGRSPSVCSWGRMHARRHPTHRDSMRPPKPIHRALSIRMPASAPADLPIVIRRQPCRRDRARPTRALAPFVGIRLVQ